MWDFHNPQLSRWENLGFSHLPVRRSYFWLNYIAKRLLRHFIEIFHNFNQKAPFFYLLALSRVHFTLGGFGGPEKDQVLKVPG